MTAQKIWSSLPPDVRANVPKLCTERRPELLDAVKSDIDQVLANYVLSSGKVVVIEDFNDVAQQTLRYLGEMSTEGLKSANVPQT